MIVDYKPLQGRWSNRTIHGKLTVPDVYAIRRWDREHPPPPGKKRPYGDLARQASRYGISQVALLDVLARRSWTRLPPEPVYWKSEPSAAFWSWWLTIWIFLSLCEAVHGRRDQPAAAGWRA